MKRSRYTSFAIIAVTVIAVGTLLLENTGFLTGAFRTEILARVDDGDVVNAADIAGGTMR
ncbi:MULTISPECIES: hypothetical protein [Rhizobium]|uniref:Uncharacterized protein n=2 Tax=Rhizobium TaxID=379 RepID=A0A192TBZ6_9HYPH|nr:MULTISPECIES: hypothetical protein [Rhizobium]ACE91430.1 hypothetical protein RHECIAT_CH0002478 [Rhizobium etli CIAT 652]ANL40854.1 hypothetical protein AMC88_CH02475 [Rhizobium phaseoli]ANL53589.1 hypothetical protein AMC86_CH02460 [Rhizobium phaseoli]ANL59842.1 hypothetical protein AMC85_CH02474 [Rhizobium phaseoli]ANL85235.1 hypothetical protein AMC81_CH02473 [Rhizobium phaseoli]